MAHLSLSQFFLVLVYKRAVSLQSISLLFPLLSPPPQHLANLQPTIILALSGNNADSQMKKKEFPNEKKGKTCSNGKWTLSSNRPIGERPRAQDLIKTRHPLQLIARTPPSLGQHSTAHRAGANARSAGTWQCRPQLPSSPAESRSACSWGTKYSSMQIVIGIAYTIGK